MHGYKLTGWFCCVECLIGIPWTLILRADDASFWEDERYWEGLTGSNNAEHWYDPVSVSWLSWVIVSMDRYPVVDEIAGVIVTRLSPDINSPFLVQENTVFMDESIKELAMASQVNVIVLPAKYGGGWEVDTVTETGDGTAYRVNNMETIIIYNACVQTSLYYTLHILLYYLESKEYYFPWRAIMWKICNIIHHSKG